MEKVIVFVFVFLIVLFIFARNHSPRLYTTEQHLRSVQAAINNPADSNYLFASVDAIEFLWTLMTIAPVYTVARVAKNINNVLSVHYEISEYYAQTGKLQDNVPQLFEFAIKSRQLALVHLHELVFTAAKTKQMTDVLEDAIASLEKILAFELDSIHVYYLESVKDQNVFTHFVSYGFPLPFDPQDDIHRPYFR